MNYPFFVYGTLRSQASHHHLIEKWVMVQKKATIEGKLYHMPIQGELGWHPYLVKGTGVVHGELFTFSQPDRIIPFLDDFEDNGLIYERTLHQVICEENQEHLAWTYFIKKGQDKLGKLIQSGDWVTEIKEGNVLPPP